MPREPVHSRLKAYYQGRAAWMEQVPLGSNPYVQHTHPVEHLKWQDGWRAARADSLLHSGAVAR